MPHGVERERRSGQSVGDAVVDSGNGGVVVVVVVVGAGGGGVRRIVESRFVPCCADRLCDRIPLWPTVDDDDGGHSWLSRRRGP